MSFDFKNVKVSIHGDVVHASYDTGNILIGTVQGDMPYSDFKTFLSQMNGLVAAHEKAVRDVTPKEAA